MPTGIILKSASHEESDEIREKNLAAVVESAGYEVAPKETEATVEPKREDFDNEEEFEAAHVEWQDAQEEVEEPAKPAAAATPKKSKNERRKERAVAAATEALQKELREAREKLAKYEAEKPAEKELVKPKRADFTDEEKYEEALLAWGIEKAKKEDAIKQAEDANKARFEKTVQNYAAQVEEAREEHEDWDELKAKFDAEDVFIGRETQLAILELENGAEVIYHLMRHPATAKKLGETCRVNPLSAVMEVGRLSARLKTGAPASGEADGGETQKPKPRVPAPVRTVSTGGTTGELSFAEIAAKPNYPGKAKDLRIAAAAGRA